MVTIREFAKDDFPSVKRIYQEGIDTGNATFQTKAKDWLEWDAGLLQHSRLIASDRVSIIAWAGLSAVSSRCVYAGVAEVTIYVSAAARGKGVGKVLLSALVESSEKHGIWSLKAGIFPENQASIHLHELCGFKILGVQDKLGKMAGTWRDVVLMERRSKTVGVD